MPPWTRGSDMAEHTGFWRETWRGLHRRPKFVVAAALIAFVVVVALFPALFTGADPDLCRSGPEPARAVGRALVRHRPAGPRHLCAHRLRCAGLGHRRAGGNPGRVRRRRGTGRAGRLLRGLGGRGGLPHHRRVLRVAAAVGRHRAHGSPAPPHGVDGDRHPGLVRLAAGGQDRPRRGARGARQRLCVGGRSVGAEPVSESCCGMCCPTSWGR